jgi:hypothetical protein
MSLKNRKTLSKCFKSSPDRPPNNPPRSHNSQRSNFAQERPRNPPSQIRNPESQPLNPRPSVPAGRVLAENRQEAIPANERPQIQFPQTKKPLKTFQILTNIKDENLIVAESKPSPQTLKHVKYLCPICFRYFNKILQFSCCKNYICLFCAQDINDTLLAGNGKMNARCCFCSNEQCLIKDVRPTSDVKFMGFKRILGFIWANGRFGRT